MEYAESRVYKTSRRAFVGNYIIAALVVVFLVILFLQFNLTFTFFPRTSTEMLSSLGVLGALIVIVFLIEEPVIKRMIHHFIVTNNEVIKVEGLITKKRISIPYQSVADVVVEKGVWGRIFNFGDVLVRGVGKGENIEMTGMKYPDDIYNLLQNRINLMRSAFIKKKRE